MQNPLELSHISQGRRFLLSLFIMMPVCDCRLVVMVCLYWHWPAGSVQQCNTVEKSWTDDQWLDVKWWVLARWSLFYCLWFNCSILACLSPHMCSGMTLGHPVMTIQRYLTTNSYVFYEVANSYDLTHMILYGLSRPQWRVGLGAGLGVGHLYKFIRIVQLVKYVRFSKNRMNLYEWGRTN